MMKAILSPASIAVVGGSNDLRKPGGRVVANLLGHAHPPVCVVHAEGELVQGLPTYPSPDDLPDAPELAIVAIPAPQAVDAVRRLAARGTRGFIVLSAGFGETDESGRRLEQALRDVVVNAGAALIGPNSLGVFTPRYVGTFGGPRLTPIPGTIEFISASGSTAAFIIEAGLERGLPFASLVSVGNSVQYGVEDVLAHDQVVDDPPPRTRLLYMESIRAPRALLEHARRSHASARHIIALKAGTTEAGARAASSHTGAMATRDDAVSALFDKAGIVRVRSGAEMVNVAGLLTCYRAPRGRRIAIITHAGGPGIILSDELTRRGFTIPPLTPASRSRLERALLPGSATGNPIDFLAAGTADHLRQIFQVLSEHERDNIDAACVIYGSPGLFNVWPVFQTIIDAVRTLPFPVYPVLPSVRTAAQEARRFRDAGYFYFVNEVDLAVALDRVVHTPPPAPADPVLPDIDRAAVDQVLREVRANRQHRLDPRQVQRILRACGFDQPPCELVASADDAMRAAADLGYPVVLKAADLLHKTDQGGVRLGLRTSDEVRAAFQQLAAIPGAKSILVQRQVDGIELIVGLSREGAFGHLVLLGLGGIYAEVLGDSATGLSPLSREEADRLISRLRAQRLIDGFRGRRGVDRTTLATALQRLCALAQHVPAIQEMDINPLMGTGEQLWAVDARIQVEPRELL
jgi:acyl-CoA synthetase (NDP forming)